MRPRRVFVASGIRYTFEVWKAELIIVELTLYIRCVCEVRNGSSST